MIELILKIITTQMESPCNENCRRCNSPISLKLSHVTYNVWRQLFLSIIIIYVSPKKFFHCTLVYILVIDVIYIYTFTAECDVTKEACVWETFKANCSGNQFLVVEKALFGRFRSSRCFNLTRNEGPCHSDVLLFAERRCSGRRDCTIKLTNENLKLFPSNCSVYSPKSLQIAYKCIEGKNFLVIPY